MLNMSKAKSKKTTEAKEILNQEDFFTIIRVKDISFSVNEKTNVDDPLQQEIKIDLNVQLSTVEEKNIIDITTRVFLHHPETPQVVLADTYVENLFEVADIKKFITSKGLMIPPELLISMLSISISHTRALLAKNISGTFYEDFILPIVDPVSVASHFFPNMMGGRPIPKPVRQERKLLKPRTPK
jgi:hypothetical protein